MKLGLGTVQFGMDYGIGNPGGRTPPAEVARILEAASRAGVAWLDTAHGYGESEATLGHCLPAEHRFRIVTKTPVLGAGPVGAAQLDAVRLALHASLRRLRQPRVDGLLVHAAADLLADGGERLVDVLRGLQQQNLVGRIGVSVYDAREIDAVLNRFRPDIVQLPVSVFDQRLLRSGHLAALHRAGIEVHARSVFLQGLLLMTPDRLPARLEPARDHLRRYRDALARGGIDAVCAALGFVLGLDAVGAVICGVADLAQFETLLAASAAPPPVFESDAFALADPCILNPARWNATA